MNSTVTRGTLVAASAVAGLLFSAGPATAQTVDDFVPDCATGVLAYAPGLTAGAASNANPVVGETIILTSGEGSFDPGSAVTATFNGTALSPAPVVSPTGNASVSFTVPTVDPGTFIVIFTGTRDGAANVVGVCFGVSADIGGAVEETAVLPEVLPEEAPAPAPAPAAPVAQPIAAVEQVPAQRPAALPFTGSVELVAVTGLGAALIAVGAGTVLLARRRRDTVAAA